MKKKEITYYKELCNEFNDPTAQLYCDWRVWIASKHDNVIAVQDLQAFWESMSERCPELSKIATALMWLPWCSVAVEASFSDYKQLLTDRRTNLTPQNTKAFSMLYYNGK